MKQLIALSIVGLLAACQSTSDLNTSSADMPAATGECCSEKPDCCAEQAECCVGMEDKCADKAECSEMAEGAVCPVTGAVE